MIAGANVAEVAALMGDPARANILAALMDGRALTATELAYFAGVSPQTTSGHLAKLVEGRLLAVEAQGRHRYYRLASATVGQAVESLMELASEGPPRYRPPARGDAAIRAARTCYDHLAGRLGVALTDALIARGQLAGSFELTPEGTAFLEELGLPVARLRVQRRALTRRCLDWSERRPHVGGALGAALAERCFELGWIARIRDSRAVQITPAGVAAFDQRFGVRLDA